jgi:hypothetical protein
VPSRKIVSFFKKNPGRNCVRNNRREEEVEMVAGRIWVPVAVAGTKHPAMAMEAHGGRAIMGRAGRMPHGVFS